MALGDIHNHNGSVCKASKAPCPFGDGGHSKDIPAFVEHHVAESGIDGASVRAMIADGTPPADAVEVAKIGLTSAGVSISKEQEAYEDEINREAFGELQTLTGAKREAAIRAAEAALAAIHGVRRAAVVETGNTYSVRAEGLTHVYSKSFERLGSFDESAAEDYKAALVSGHARELAAGKSYIVYTADNAMEFGDWPIGGFLGAQPDGAGDTYTLPSGGTVPKAEYDRLNSLMNATTFDGHWHGFHYGIAVRPESDLPRSDFEKLSELQAARELDVPAGAILVDAVSLDARKPGSDDPLYESYYMMLTPDGGAEDVY